MLELHRVITSTIGSFSLSKEREAFIEIIFSERMEYATWKAKVAKHSPNVHRWIWW